jgi:predicted small lipoprotein YifL
LMRILRSLIASALISLLASCGEKKSPSDLALASDLISGP